MTRHEMARTPAVGSTPQAATPHASMVISMVNAVAENRRSSSQNRADVTFSIAVPAIEPLSGGKQASTSSSRNAKSP